MRAKPTSHQLVSNTKNFVVPGWASTTPKRETSVGMKNLDQAFSQIGAAINDSLKERADVLAKNLASWGGGLDAMDEDSPVYENVNENDGNNSLDETFYDSVADIPHNVVEEPAEDLGVNEVIDSAEVNINVDNEGGVSVDVIEPPNNDTENNVVQTDSQSTIESEQAIELSATVNNTVETSVPSVTTKSPINVSADFDRYNDESFSKFVNQEEVIPCGLSLLDQANDAAYQAQLQELDYSNYLSQSLMPSAPNQTVSSPNKTVLESTETSEGDSTLVAHSTPGLNGNPPPFEEVNLQDEEKEGDSADTTEERADLETSAGTASEDNVSDQEDMFNGFSNVVRMLY
jgi:hypothetical protein